MRLNKDSCYTVASATFVVAASDSLHKERADYVCDGVDDQVEIQAAIDALPANGGEVVLLEGTYNITAQITKKDYANIRGCGIGSTTLDVSSMVSLHVIELGDYSSLSNLKISGTLTPLPTAHSHKTFAGNHCKIFDIMITATGHGIEAANKKDVVIENAIFTNIRDVEDWGPAIHVAGTADGFFINNVYIEGCNRGIEIEDGAKNVFVSKGYLKSIKNYNGTGNASFSLDVHVHDGGGGVDNVVFRDVYLEDTWGVSVSNVGAMHSDADMPRNIHIENITHKNMRCYILLNGHFITAKNIKVYDTTADTALFRFGINSKHIEIDGVETYNYNPPTAIPIYIFNDENDIRIKNLKMPWNFASTVSSVINLEKCSNILIEDINMQWSSAAGADSAIKLGDCTNAVIENVEITDFTGTYAIYVPDAISSHVSIKHCKVAMDNASPGNYGFLANGYNITLEDNLVLGNPVDFGIRLLGSHNHVHGNFIENGNMIIWSGATNAVVFGNILANGNIVDNGAGTMCYTKHSDLFMDVLAVSATHVRLDEDLSEAIPNTFTITAQPDVPRTLSGHFNSHAQITAYTIVIRGTDAKDNTVTETFTEAASPWDFETVNAYATITSIKMTSRTGTGAGDTMDIGITDVLGLSNIIYETGDVFKIKKNNANAAVATAQVNKTYDTYDMSVIGLGAADDFTIWYKSNLNIIS